MQHGLLFAFAQGVSTTRRGSRPRLRVLYGAFSLQLVNPLRRRAGERSQLQCWLRWPQKTHAGLHDPAHPLTRSCTATQADPQPQKPTMVTKLMTIRTTVFTVPSQHHTSIVNSASPSALSRSTPAQPHVQPGPRTSHGDLSPPRGHRYVTARMQEDMLRVLAVQAVAPEADYESGFEGRREFPNLC
jgi:hypothetical protein